MVATPPLPVRPLPVVGRLLPGVYFGWIVTLGLAAVAFVGVGIGFYVQTVLLDALPRTHGWSKASVSGAASLYFVVSALAGAVVGRAADHWGGRRWLALGAVVLALSLLALGRVSSPTELYLLFPIMAIGFALCGNVPASAILARWFVTRRAVAMSISYTGVSLGGIALVPVATWLVEARGLGFAVTVLAAVTLGIALPVVAFVLRDDPREHGLLPDGERRPDVDDPHLSLEWQRLPWRARDAMRTRAFWLLALAFSGVLFSQMGTLVHALSLLRESMSVGPASLAVSGIALGSTLGRLALGSVADRLDKRRLATLLCAIQAAALLVFSAVEGTVTLFAIAFLFGGTVGNLFMLQSLIVGELYGMTSFGRVYGLLTLVTQVAGGLGPAALGLLYEHFDGYTVPLRLLACISLGSALVLRRVRSPKEPLAGPR